MKGLPNGLVLELHPQVRVRDHGATLIGGAPLRVIHLKPAARQHLSGTRLTITDEASARVGSHLLATGMAGPALDLLPDPAADDITCVIPVKDRPAGVDRLLAALGGTFPVIVVDDGSDDPDATVAVCQQHDARLVRLRHNQGPAGARNAGLAHVTTPFVLFIDSDVTIDAQDVLLLGRHLCDPRLAVIAPRVVGSLGDTGCLAAYEAARSALDLGPHAGLVHPRSRIGWLPAACLLARVEALDHGFDPTMRVGEDVDLVWRLIDRGWRVRYEPRVTAHHEHGRSLRQWLARTAYYGTGGALLVARHGTKVAPAVLPPVSAAIGTAILAQRRWSAPATAALSALMIGQLTRTLRRDPHPVVRAAELTALGYTAILGQAMSLLLRHWWPATALAATRSRRIRRATLLAAVADAAIDYARTRPDLDPVTFTVLRRLDDLAYGAGLWAGALRARSAAALCPDFLSEQRHRRRGHARDGARSGSALDRAGAG